MKNWLRLSKLMVLLCLLSISVITQGQAFERIAGFKVLATHTSQNTACMKPGNVRVILQATEPTVEDFLKNAHPTAILQSAQQLGTKQQIEFEFVGPTVTVNQINTNRQSWNTSMQKTGCVSLAPLRSGADGDEITSSTSMAGYAIFENTDAGSYTDDNAQSVVLNGPTTIGNPPLASALLNNVKTDSTTFYFLQDGFLFNGGSGSVVWTDTTQGYVAQTYSGLTYSGGANFWFTITYTNGVWWMCGYSYNTGSYVCVMEANGSGTTLGADINTNIFLENHNTTSNWYTGFGGSFQAWGAQIYRNGIGQNWSAQHRHTAHSCSTSYPVSGAITGSLVGGGTGSYTLSGIPLSC